MENAVIPDKFKCFLGDVNIKDINDKRELMPAMKISLDWETINEYFKLFIFERENIIFILGN